MPSAANAKSEKPASSEATDNSPIRQIMTIIEHKIRNLEKRKSKLTSYRDLQKAGKELNADQKVAVAKYDEVAQTLEFARDLSKQVTSIATSAEREAKKQAKKDAWVRYAADTSKIREVLLILDCLMQMGNPEAREDFLSGTNGAAKLTQEDLKILDDLYPQVTPKHEQVGEEAGFQVQITRAAEHLYGIIDGKQKDVLGTTYAHIKQIITAVHECGYFDKSFEVPVTETEENVVSVEEELQETLEDNSEITVVPVYVQPTALPVPPAPAVVPAPAYPLRPIPPITLQEVEHAYFAQQYPQQRPLSEVIGSQNFFFLQESEIDSPIGTPQPPPILNQTSPPSQIPTQTFTNQHYVLPPQPHFAPHPDHAGYQPVPIPGSMAPVPAHVTHHIPQAAIQTIPQPTMQQPVHQPPIEQPAPVDEKKAPTPVEDKNENEWKEVQSPDSEEIGDRKTQGQGDGQNRYRRGYGGGGRGRPNGYRGRGSYQSRPNSDGYHNRGEYQGRSNKDGYQSRQYDNYQNRHPKDGYQNRGSNDGYYGNGDTGDAQESGRDRYNNESQSYQGGFKSRGRGGQRGRPAQRGPRPQYTRRQENVE